MKNLHRFVKVSCIVYSTYVYVNPIQNSALLMLPFPPSIHCLATHDEFDFDYESCYLKEVVAGKHAKIAFMIIMI